MMTDLYRKRFFNLYSPNFFYDSIQQPFKFIDQYTFILGQLLRIIVPPYTLERFSHGLLKDKGHHTPLQTTNSFLISRDCRSRNQSTGNILNSI